MKEFDNDIFISYAHFDNDRAPDTKQGWVDRFDQTLRCYLKERLGKEARIWRDNELGGTKVFSTEIKDKLLNSALLISILTKRYTESDSCKDELKNFCDNADRSGGLTISNSCRVLKVILDDTVSHLEKLEFLPASVRESNGFEFFTREDGKSIKLDPDFGQEYASEFKKKIYSLAIEARGLIEQLNEQLNGGPESGVHSISTLIDPSKTVFLAECGQDRIHDRDAIAEDLKTSGYHILPDKRLPDEEDKFREVVNEMLARSRLSIHLIGSNPGRSPDGTSQKPITTLQNEMAAALSSCDRLQRVIWLPKGTKSDSVQHQSLIDNLLTNSAAQKGADLITGDLYQLKNTIHNKLKELGNTPRMPEKPAELGTDQSSPMVYVVCKKEDVMSKATLPLEEWLLSEKIDHDVPAFDGSPEEILEANKRLYVDCSAVIYFYGECNDSWMKIAQNEHKKQRAYRKGRPLIASFTYLAQPLNEYKQLLIDRRVPNLINGLSGFTEDSMAEFKQAMSQSGVLL